MEYIIITFPNTHSAMACEEALKDKIDLTVMPTPTSITKSCGIALRFNLNYLDRVLEQISKKNLIYQHIYIKEKSEYTKLY